MNMANVRNYSLFQTITIQKPSLFGAAPTRIALVKNTYPPPPPSPPPPHPHPHPSSLLPEISDTGLQFWFVRY